MKCPRCQTENYEGANFCTACGCMIPKESRAKKLFMTLLRALLYVALFMGNHGKHTLGILTTHIGNILFKHRGVRIRKT